MLGSELAVVYLPVAFGMEAHLQKAVLRVVPLAAAGTDEVAAPGGALAIVVFGDCESCSATARDQEHAEGALRGTGGIAADARSLRPAKRQLRSG